MKKKSVKKNVTIQIGCSVFHDSKSRMLELYYDCLYKYLDRSDFQYIETDTDSAYMSLVGDFEKLVNQN